MKTAHLPKQWMFASILSLLAFSAFLPIAQAGDREQVGAPRTTDLLAGADCEVAVSDSNHHYSGMNQTPDTNVAIDRQLYNSQFQMRVRANHYIALICEVDNSEDGYDTLELHIGVADNDIQQEPLMTINIYQSGSIISAYRDVIPGRLIETIVDLQNFNVANPEDISIEIDCHKTLNPGKSCRAYILEANLSSANSIIPTSQYSPAPSNPESPHPVTRSEPVNSNNTANSNNRQPNGRSNSSSVLNDINTGVNNTNRLLDNLRNIWRKF
ncbi:MAG: hypothetical protein F6K19_32070 [Cyanothece sp. SIO1E1]|nr:hypothetical protein [Cyanothece sp. SIO1E1]